MLTWLLRLLDCVTFLAELLLAQSLAGRELLGLGLSNSFLSVKLLLKGFPLGVELFLFESHHFFDCSKNLFLYLVFVRPVLSSDLLVQCHFAFTRRSDESELLAPVFQRLDFAVICFICLRDALSGDVVIFIYTLGSAQALLIRSLQENIAIEATLDGCVLRSSLNVF